MAALLTGVETRATFLKTHYPSFVDFVRAGMLRFFFTATLNNEMILILLAS